MIYFALLIPLFTALIYLLTALAFKVDTVFYGSFWFDLPPLVLVVSSFLWLYRKYVLRRELSTDFWLHLCFLAPFALWYPWVITRGSGGGNAGFGGFLYFVEWLSKHPNFAGVNIQVLIGLACMLAVSLLPAIYAFHALSEKPRMGMLLTIYSVCLIAFMPVFIRLDLMLWISGFSGAELQNSAQIAVHGLELAYGPLLHTAAISVMSWHVVSTLINKPANYY